MTRITFPGGSYIDDGELEFRVSRSSGPGGQGVNTTDSKVELRWVVGESALSDTQKERIRLRLGNRITRDDVLILKASEERSQHRNKEAVVARFRAIVGEALRPPATRRATRPTFGSKQRRLESKKQRSEVKKQRQRPDW